MIDKEIINKSNTILFTTLQRTKHRNTSTKLINQLKSSEKNQFNKNKANQEMKNDKKITQLSDNQEEISYQINHESYDQFRNDIRRSDFNEVERISNKKQGKLFTEEPDFLKGFGLHGDEESSTFDAIAQESIQNIGDQNKSINLNGLQLSHSQFFECDSKNQSEQFTLQNKGKFDNHQNEIQFSESDIKHMTSSNQTSCFNYDFFQGINNEKQSKIQQKIQDAIRANQTENFDDSLTNNTSVVHKSRDNSEYVQGYKKSVCSKSAANNESVQINRRRITTKFHIHEKNNQKLVEKLIDVQMAKNIIYGVIKKSSNRQSRIQAVVLEFLNRLKELTPNRKCTNLSQHEYGLINDLSVVLSIKKQSHEAYSSLSKRLKRLMRFLPKINVFLPTDLSLIIWDSVVIFFNYSFFYIISILIFFDFHEKESSLVQFFQQIACVLFLVEIIVNFNIAYYNSDSVVTKRKEIAIKYIKSPLIFDVTSFTILLMKCVSTDVSLQYNPDQSIFIYCRNMLLFAKLLTVNEKIKRIQDYLIFNENQKQFLKMVSLIIFIAFIAHIGTMWHTVAIFESKQGVEKTWLSNLNILESPFYTRYFYSVYWTVTTMCTIGYGDITPQNQYEALISSISMIFLSCVFAYSINNIGMIMQEIEKNSKTLRDEINTFQRFRIMNRLLNRKKVNLDLKSRVRNYLKFLSDQQKNRDKEKEDQIFSKLSNKLRDEVTTEINTSILNKYQLFSNQFSKQTLNKMVFVMKEVLISPNEIIFNDCDLDDQSIYFIADGVIEIFHNIQIKSSSQLRIKILSKNDCFGEISFFSGLPRCASARSLNLSTLYKISRSDFLNIVSQNKYDFQKFKMIQDKISVLKDLTCIQLKCYNCQKSNHLARDCPSLHQRFDSQFLALKQVYSIEQTRDKCLTKRHIKQNSRILVGRNQSQIQIIREKHQSYFSLNQISSFQEEELEFAQQEQNSSQSSTTEMFEDNESQLQKSPSSVKQKSSLMKGFQSPKDSILYFQDVNEQNESHKLSDRKEGSDHKTKSLNLRSSTKELFDNAFIPQQTQLIKDIWIFIVKERKQVIKKIKGYKQLQLEHANSFENACANINSNLFKKTIYYLSKKVTFDQNKSEDDQSDKIGSPPPLNKESTHRMKSSQTLNSQDIYENGLANIQVQGKCLPETQTINVNSQDLQKLSKEPQQTSVHAQFQYSSSLNAGTNNKSKMSNYLIPSYTTIPAKTLQNIPSLGSQLKQQFTLLQSQEEINQNIRTDTSEYDNSFKLKQIQQQQQQSTILDLLLDVSKSINKERSQYHKSMKDQTPLVYETIQSYIHYFPHNNFEKIIHEYRVKKQEQILLGLIHKKNQRNSARSKRQKKSSENFNNQPSKNQMPIGADNSVSQSLVFGSPSSLNYGISINREKMCFNKLDLEYSQKIH